MKTSDKSYLINKIINNLEKKGESKDYIIGCMSAMINGLMDMNEEQSMEYINKTLAQTSN